PVALGVALSVLFFFVQQDLGPALLLLGLFLSLYAVTRREVGLALAGLATVFGAFAVSYAIGFPRTVSLRTAMWLDPWQNGLARGRRQSRARRGDGAAAPRPRRPPKGRGARCAADRSRPGVRSPARHPARGARRIRRGRGPEAGLDPGGAG